MDSLDNEVINYGDKTSLIEVNTIVEQEDGNFTRVAITSEREISNDKDSHKNPNFTILNSFVNSKKENLLDEIEDVTEKIINNNNNNNQETFSCKSIVGSNNLLKIIENSCYLQIQTYHSHNIIKDLLGKANFKNYISQAKFTITRAQKIDIEFKKQILNFYLYSDLLEQQIVDRTYRTFYELTFSSNNFSNINYKKRKLILNQYSINEYNDFIKSLLNQFKEFVMLLAENLAKRFHINSPSINNVMPKKINTSPGVLVMCKTKRKETIELSDNDNKHENELESIKKIKLQKPFQQEEKFSIDDRGQQSANNERVSLESDNNDNNSNFKVIEKILNVYWTTNGKLIYEVKCFGIDEHSFINEENFNYPTDLAIFWRNWGNKPIEMISNDEQNDKNNNNNQSKARNQSVIIRNKFINKTSISIVSRLRRRTQQIRVDSSSNQIMKCYICNKSFRFDKRKFSLHMKKHNNKE